MRTSLSSMERLGLRCSAAEAAATLRLQDYSYPAQLSAQALARLREELNAGAAGATKGPLQGPLEGAPAVVPTAAAAKALEDPFHGGHPHLGLELDDDCLRLLLGEDEDETPAARAAPQPPSRPVTRAGKASAPAAAGSANGSEKSSACHEEPGNTAATAGDAEAASAQLGQGQEEDDDVALLFHSHAHAPAAEHHHSASRHGAPLEPLELHLLGTAPLGAADDADSASHADAGDGGDTAGAGAPKRARPSVDASPSRRGLLLSMDYEAAAESINLELLGGRSKVVGCADAPGLASLLFTPLMDLAPPQLDTPDSPDSLASGSDCAVPPPALTLQRADSCGKRKRAVEAQ